MIREAQTGDEPAVKECGEQVYAPHVDLLGRKPAPMVADFARQIASGEVYVAVDDEGLLRGFIVFRTQDRHMFLESVAVLPGVTRSGIAKSLIVFCEDEARRRDLGAIRLYTNEKMTANLSIYPRLGYVEIGPRIEDGFHRVFFEKTLD